MLSRNRQHDSLEHPEQPQDGAGAGGNLGEHRARAQEASAAAANAVQNALSNNAANFLKMSEQHGGQ